MMVRVVHEQHMLHVSARAHGGDSKSLPVGSGLALGSPGHPEDGGLSDQFQSPMSEGSYKEGPASVPEPSLPEDFLEEEEQYQEFGLRADLGDEGFIDRREETIAVFPQKLSPDEVPDKEPDFKTCLNDYSPAGTRRRFYSPDQSREAEHEFPEDDEGWYTPDKQQMQETTAGITTQPTHPKTIPSLDTHDTELESLQSVSATVPKSSSEDFVDRSSDTESAREEAAVGSTIETTRSSFGDDYHRTEIEITEKETIITDRTVLTDQCTIMSPVSRDDDETRTQTAPADQEKDDADTGLPEGTLFSPFDKHREEVPTTEEEKREVAETYFEQLAQFESQGTRQHIEEEDYVEAHEELPTGPDMAQTAETVADTAFDQEELPQPSTQKPTEGTDQEVVTYETAPEDFELEEGYEEAEGEISEREKEQATTDTDIYHLSDEKEQEELAEAEDTHRPDHDVQYSLAEEYTEKETEDFFETEEQTKEDGYHAGFAADSKQIKDQLEEQDGLEKHEMEDRETEHFSEASDEMVVEQTEERLGEDRFERTLVDVSEAGIHSVVEKEETREERQQLFEAEYHFSMHKEEEVTQKITVMPSSEVEVCEAKEATEAKSEAFHPVEADHHKVEETEILHTSEDAVYPILGTEEEQISEEKYELPQARQTEQYEQEELDEGPETLQLEAHAEKKTEDYEERKSYEDTLSALETTESAELRQKGDDELIMDSSVPDVKTTEPDIAVLAVDELPHTDSQWTEERLEERQDEEDMETQQAEGMYLDTEAEPPAGTEEQDEEWEILDKSELTEEEQIAAMDDTLMLTMTSQDEQTVTEAQEEARDQEPTQYLLTENLEAQLESEDNQIVEPGFGSEAFLSKVSEETEEKTRETESAIQDQPTRLDEGDGQSETSDVSETEDKIQSKDLEIQALKPVKEGFYQEVVTTTQYTELSDELSYGIREQRDYKQEIFVQHEVYSDEVYQQQLVDEDRLLKEDHQEESEQQPQKERALPEQPEEPSEGCKPDEDLEETYKQEEDHVSPDGYQAEEKTHTEAFLSTETHALEVEGFTREIDDMKSPAMSQSTESTEAQMISSEEALFGVPSQDQELMAMTHSAEAEEMPHTKQPDVFEAESYEQYSDESEEELQPLKMSGGDSPAQEMRDDFVQDTMDQSDRPVLETQEPRLSPTLGESPDQQGSLSEEKGDKQLSDSPFQEEKVGEETGRSLLQEQQTEIFEEETEIEQVAVHGILAEIQDMEQYAAQDESEEEGEDDLEQYEETYEETDASEQVSKTQDRDQEKHVDEELVSDRGKTETETFEASIKVSAESQDFIDRVESFSLEERDTSVQYKDITETQKDEEEEEIPSDQFVDRAESFLEETVETTDLNEEEKQQRDVALSDDSYIDRAEHFLEETLETTQADKEDEDEREEEFSADMYVDRTERFVEEPVETVAGRIDPAAEGPIPEVTGTDSAVSDAEDQQFPAQTDVSTEHPFGPSDEPHDGFEVSSDTKVEESTQREAASAGFTYSYTSQFTSVTHTSKSTASHEAAADQHTSGSEFERDSKTTLGMSEEMLVEQTFQERHEEYRRTEMYEEDLSERPMSPSEYTLITSHGGHPAAQTLDVHPEEEIAEEEERDKHSDEESAADEQGSEQPPSPTEYTLVSSQEQEALTEVLGLQTEATMSAQQAENIAPQESCQEALIQFPDFADDHAASDPSSDQYLEKHPDQTDDFPSQTEPSAPYMSPSSEAKGIVRSSSYENLYQNISVTSEPPLEPATAQDLDIGDRFDSRHTEPHLQSAGRTSSFEDLYVVGITPVASAIAPGGDEVLGAAAAAAPSPHDGPDDDRLSSASSDAARLEDVEDGAAGAEDRSIRTDEDESGDDNNEDVGPHGDDDEAYTHRVVMKKEVHQKTTIRGDGQEETVITEDSQIHQDSEPPEALRHSMEEIIQQFMTDSPQMPRVRGVDDDDRAEEGDEGTEV